MSTTTTETTPDAALQAVRWGFTSLDDLTGRVPERLRAYVERVVVSSSFRHEVAKTQIVGRQSTPRPMNPDEIADRLTQECARIDAAAIKETEARARFEQTHRCTVTGLVDATTEARVAPWGGDRIVCSARGHAILARVWTEDATTDELTAARALLPTTTEQAPPPRRRKSA